MNTSSMRRSVSYSLLRPLVVAALVSGGVVGTALAGPSSADSKTPKHGVQPSGGTTTNPMAEGTEAGAPGGVVKATEAQSMKSHDVDANGMIDEKEAGRDPNLKEQFSKLDANGDGQLDRTEFDKFKVDASAASGSAKTKPVEPAR